MNELLRQILFLPEQASTFSVRVDRLHFFVILTTTIASSMIGLVGLYFLIRWRRRQGQRTTEAYYAPRWLEGAIIAVPLSFFLLWFGIGFRDYVWMNNVPRGAMDVHVVAKQWMWKFAYPGGPNGIDTLTVPEGRPVRLLLTSRDVIHSFFVPAFRIKQDALPGRYTQIWFEASKAGRYPVFCTEFCGSGHSVMRAEVRVLKPAEFDAWIAGQRRGLAPRQDMGSFQAASSIAQQGRLVAERFECLKCHSTDGTAHIGPTWVDLYMRRQRVAGGGTVVADEAYLTQSMMDPLAKVVDGYQPVMPTYQGRLSAAESAALVEYIKSLRTGRVSPGPTEGPVYQLPPKAQPQAPPPARRTKAAPR